MSRILLTGANGQVGWELRRLLPSASQIIALTRAELDLGRPEAIRQAVRLHQPDIIINPAAYTAVDKAESEPEQAMAVNGIAPGILAEEAKAQGALLIHYSTDYVFDGSKPAFYLETDTPNPQSVYGQTKLAGEEAIRASGVNHLIFRTSWVYGVHGGNFLKTVLRLVRERSELRIVADQVGAPTWARLLGRVTAEIVKRWQERPEQNLCGLYHLTAGGQASWHRYAEEIVSQARQYDDVLAAKALDIRPIATHEYPLPAKRPANSLLATGKFRQAFNIELPQWQDDLADCVRELYELNATTG